MSRRRELTAVSDLIDAVLRRVAQADVAPIVSLRRSWGDVAAEWADRCQPVGLRNGVLTVEVGSGLDASTLRFDGDRLLAAVAEHLGGTEQLTRLAIRVSPPGKVQND